MLLALAFAPLVAPAPPVTTPAEAPPVLVVRSAADLGLAEATVQRALQGHFADLGYDVHVDFAPGARPWPPATVRVELLRDEDGGVEVVMQREVDGTPWSRTLPAQPSRDLQLESLGIVVRSMLGAPASAAPDPEPEPERQAPVQQAPARPPPPPPRHGALDLGLGYRGDTVAAAQRWHSSIAVDVGGRTHRGLAFGGAVAYTPPHGGGGLDVQRIGGQLRLGAAFRPGTRIQPAVFALIAGEGLSWSGAPEDSTAKPGWAARVGAGVSAEVRAFVARQWFLAARLSMVGWALGATLEESHGSARSTLLRTESVSGAVWVGVGYRWAISQ